MKSTQVFITGMGMVSSAGKSLSHLKSSIINGISSIRAPEIFQVLQNPPLPVGEVKLSRPEKPGMPRTHTLFAIAAKEAMKEQNSPPDAIITGITTGGMPETENHLKAGENNPEFFKFHNPGTVTEYIAGLTGCKGPVMTISTACSSGAVAIKIALEMLAAGKFKKILAGGGDSLCRLTYYGFNFLQLIDPDGAKPFDKNRKGMNVAEGAAMLFLETGPHGKKKAMAKICGAGLSCDAFHPTAPHPAGKGAKNAMKKAVGSMEISKPDYIHLHGTGTPDNDKSEALAIKSLFGNHKPHCSSSKGFVGHSLAGSGAFGAVISAMAIKHGFLPANIGITEPDPEFDLNLVSSCLKKNINTALVNSLGFGGNNASVFIASPKTQCGVKPKEKSGLFVAGYSLVTGKGFVEESVNSILNGKSCAGILSEKKICRILSPRSARRLKRLPKMVLSLAIKAFENSKIKDNPKSVFLGTGWGPLSETYDFLDRLFKSKEKFSSPTDFIGSVHNAPAGQVAIHFKAEGPNITTTDRNYSFEQALMAASLVCEDDPFFLMGADQYHEKLTPLFDPLSEKCDGGCALVLKKEKKTGWPQISLDFFEKADDSSVEKLIYVLGKESAVKTQFAAIFIDATDKTPLYDRFLSLSGFEGPVIDYKKITGNFASAGAVAAAICVHFVKSGFLPKALFSGTTDIFLQNKGLLILRFGKYISSTKIMP